MIMVMKSGSPGNIAQAFRRALAAAGLCAALFAVPVAHAATPGVPGTLTATADGYSEIVLRWTAPADDGGKPILGYRIEFQRGMGVPQNAPPEWRWWSSWTVLSADTQTTDLTYRHDGLPAGGGRRYRVFAINADGTGPESEAAEAHADAPEIRISRITEAPVEGDEVVFTVSRPAAAASHLSTMWMWVNGSGGVSWTLSNVSKVIDGRWYGIREVRFEPGATRASVRVDTHGNGVIGTGGTLRAILDGSMSTFDEHLLTWVPNAMVRGSPSRATVEVSDSETARWAVVLSPASTAESDTETVRATVSVANGKRFAEAQTLEVAFGGSATKGEDYTVSDGALTLPAHVRSVGFDIQIVDNAAEEDEETAVVAVSHGDAAVAQATLTIRDGSNAGLPGVVTGLRAAAVGARAIALSWSAPPANGTDITGYRIEVSADEGWTWSDLESDTGSTAATSRHSGLSGKTRRDYRVSAINAVGTGPASASANARTAWQAMWIAEAPESVAEGEEVEFTLERAEDLGWTFVLLRVSGSGGVVGSIEGTLDAGNGIRMMIFYAGGDTRKTLRVGTRANGVAGAGGTVTLEIREHGFYALDEPHTATVTVSDNEPVALSVADAGGHEGTGATVVFAVTLDRAAAEQVTVDYATADGTATAGADYTETSGTLTFAPGETEKTVSVPITDDAVDDSGETFTLVLSNASGAVIADAEATGTILNTESPTEVTLSVSPDEVAESAGTTTLTVVGTLNGGVLAGSTAVLLTVSAGTAAETDDYAAGTATLTIPEGQTAGTATLTLTAVDDDIDEEDETVIVEGTVTGLEVTPDTVTITDDDNAGVTVSHRTVGVHPFARAHYTVVLDSQPSGTVTVSVEGGSSDVEVSPSTLTFNERTWSTPQTVTLFAALTTDPERLDFVLPDRLTHRVTGYGSVTDAADVAVTVGWEYDDDRPGVTVRPWTISIAAPEGGAAGSYTVVLDTEPSGTVTVTVDGAGDDLTVSPSTLTFDSTTWATAQTVTVEAVDDAIVEGQEKVRLRHTVAGYSDEFYGDVTEAKSVRVKVVDNDTAGVTVRPTSISAAEGGAAGSYTVVLDTEPSGTVTVTVDGAVDDLTVSPSTLTFDGTTWATVQTVTVEAVDDVLDEGQEEVTLSHTARGGGYDGVRIAALTVTVVDNDAVGVTVGPTSISVAEGGAAGSYTVVLDTEPSGTVTVTVDGAVDDLTVSPSTLTFDGTTWATAQTVTVEAVDNAIVEGQEEVTLTHTVAGYGEVTEAAGVTVTVVDNDAAGVTVGPTSISATEGGAAGSYTVVLGSEPSGTVTVTVDGAGDDLKVSPSTVTFDGTTWATAQTVMVEAVDDAIAEGREEVTLTHTVAGYGEVTEAADVTVTVVDNDTAGVTVSHSALTVHPLARAHYTVVLDSQPSGTVTVSVEGSSADVEVSPSTLTFNERTWSTPQTVTVFAVLATDPISIEYVPPHTLTHTVTGYGSVTKGLDVTVTVVDNDAAGVTVGPTSISAAEGGAAGSYTVVLDTEPSGTVTVTVDGAGDDRHGEPVDAHLRRHHLGDGPDGDGGGRGRRDRRRPGRGHAPAHGRGLRRGDRGGRRHGHGRRQRRGRGDGGPDLDLRDGGRRRGQLQGGARQRAVGHGDGDGGRRRGRSHGEPVDAHLRQHHLGDGPDGDGGGRGRRDR